jgi:adenosylcobinamide-phosphate synthase
MMTVLAAVAAVLLDAGFGEPRRFHPLVGFGHLAELCERWLYGAADVPPQIRRMRGLLALALLLAPLTIAILALANLPYADEAFSVWTLYFTIGNKNLADHALPVINAMRGGDEDEARRRVSLMVSRDSAALDIPGAATESVLENGNDAVFGALFWFIVAGALGAVLYRLANTLDAMWGYRNARYIDFGCAAARFDDVLNYVPARLTALTYAVLGNTRYALRCWRTQAPLWDSPNAGPVMAAGAGALGVSVGGSARYAGEWHQRPILGVGDAPTVEDIERALRLVRHGVWLWLSLLLFSAVVLRGLTHA